MKYIEKISFIGDVGLILQTVEKVFKRTDINREGTVSDMDFGDYLLQKGAISREIYEEKKAEAEELLRRGVITNGEVQRADRFIKKKNRNILRLAIDSILNQTVAPDEITIVKDGLLTPELDMVLEEYSKRKVMCSIS